MDMDTTSPQSEIDLMVEKAIREGASAEVEVETLDEAASLAPDVRRARWQSRRPSIEHLEPGIVSHPGAKDPVTGLLAAIVLPVFDVGDRIVVDIRTQHLVGTPWLETIVGKVRSIDDDTGLVSLFDEESDPRIPMVRWTSFKDGLHDFRLAPTRGNPFNAERVKAAKPPPAPGEVRRGRGRPKGSTNRPKEVVKAEREAYKAAQLAKKGKKA